MPEPKVKPALILGSGFHRHVLGDQADTERCTSPLCSWDSLLAKLAGHAGIESTCEVMPQTLRWEVLLNRAICKQREGNAHGQGTEHAPQQANEVEGTLRGYVKEIIQQEAREYPASARSSVPLDECWGSIISLNFDAAWMEAHGVKAYLTNSPRKPKPSAVRKQRLHCYKPLPSGKGQRQRRVWFPNGSADWKNTICLGLHDYGSAPHSIRCAFNALKKWERETPDPNETPDSKFQPIVNAMQHRDQTTARCPNQTNELAPLETWVADFLYRPLVFAGVGLSFKETGLWWLLVQRARNVARTSNPRKPAYVLVSGAEEVQRLQHAEPLGIRPIRCDTWHSGWEKVLQCGRKLAAGVAA